MYFKTDRQCFHYLLIPFSSLIPVVFLVPLLAITIQGVQYAKAASNVLYLFDLFHTTLEGRKTPEDLWQASLSKNPQREQQRPMAAEQSQLQQKRLCPR